MMGIKSARRAAGVFGTTAGAIALATALASPAFAAPVITVPSSDPYSVGSTSATITVEGTIVVDNVNDHYIVVAQCNAAKSPGTACNAGYSSTPILVPAGETDWEYDLDLDSSFAEINTRTGLPTGNTTTCLGSTGDPCQIQVAEYNTWPPTGGSHVGADLLGLTFP